MNKKLILLILCCFILMQTVQYAYADECFPEWLKGIFCLNLQYAKESVLGRGHCLYCIDFDAKREMIFDIDSDAVLMKDIGCDGRPIVISNIKSGANIENGRNDYIWRGYQVRTVVFDESSSALTISNGLIGKKNTIFPFYFNSPIAVLGFDSEREKVYFMQYGISEIGGLEIQMVQQERGLTEAEDVILHSFPLNYRFGAWKYAISKDGKIAWYDTDEKQIHISSEKQEIVYDHKIESFSGEICWLDNENLVYFEGSVDQNGSGLPQITYTLMQWNIVENSTKEMTAQNGKLIRFKVGNVFSPYDIALSSDNCFMACYYADMQDGLHKILFYSLENGESYIASLWSQAYSDDLDGHLGYHYRIVEDGSILFQPDGNIEVNCVWY